MRSNEVEVFDNRMVDFTKGFSHPTDLQKKISNLLQSSEIVQQKQKDLVTILNYILVPFNTIYLTILFFRKCLG